MPVRAVFAVLALLFLSSCSKCDFNEASNKVLALNKVQARVAARSEEGAGAVAGGMALATGPISELIAQEKYSEACRSADELAKKWDIDLAAEMKDMITMEQLAKDGGRGQGACSVADAAKKQMALHEKLSAGAKDGSLPPDILKTFSDDSKGYAQMLVTDPSAACRLLDDLAAKYKVQ